jgi:hypothetical protein
MKRIAGLAVALVLTLLPTGCVTRRFLITTDPPGAIVYREGQPIGATPVEDSFIYYGNYHFRIVKDGYEPLDVDEKIRPPWYEIVGIDFFSENIWPFTLRDRRCFHYTLQPQVQIRHDDLRRRAEELRGRGQCIQPPPGIEEKIREMHERKAAQPPGAVVPGAPVLPPPLPVAPGAAVPGSTLPAPVPEAPPGPVAPYTPAPQSGTIRPLSPSSTSP